MLAAAARFRRDCPECRFIAQFNSSKFRQYDSPGLGTISLFNDQLLMVRHGTFPENLHLLALRLPSAQQSLIANGALYPGYCALVTNLLRAPLWRGDSSHGALPWEKLFGEISRLLFCCGMAPFLMNRALLQHRVRCRTSFSCQTLAKSSMAPYSSML